MNEYPTTSRKRKIKEIELRKLVDQFSKIGSSQNIYDQNEIEPDNLDTKTDEELDLILKQPTIDAEQREFYNNETRANFEYWCKFTSLTIEQLTALSLGKCPEIITLQQINIFEKKYARTEFTHQYLKHYQLIEQAPLGSKVNGKFSLSKFIHWAQMVELDLPVELKAYSNINESKYMVEPQDKCYSSELDLANIVQKAMIKQFGNKIFTAKLVKEFLIKMSPKLSSTAIKRISTLVSSDAAKRGGRPKSQ